MNAAANARAACAALVMADATRPNGAQRNTAITKPTLLDGLQIVFNDTDARDKFAAVAQSGFRLLLGVD